ncbi:MAG TPA: allophanate hydrolase [Novimethylophilus sp.]|jgi:allophanate hydrolase|uniref:allophanate hydrolase n=1 Tax=Novimethylophilus sp. TaxID=2137426 RepID=UPI002F3EF8CF
MKLPTKLDIAILRRQYLGGSLTPSALVEQLDIRIGTEDPRHIWICRLTRDEMLAYAQKLEGHDPASLPLYGIPFAIKDNIDLAGIPTTAACPDYAYTPEKSAAVVQKLIDAGAIPVGKTNLDQFATGLVGARSPYGAGRNAFNPDYISGGSSAGSAVSVALGMASFSLGTDTAGSGRVPAAFNNLVGHKPTCGLLSTSGVVPACRTLDCVSIFALSADDAASVLEAAQGYDGGDPYSRRPAAGRAVLGGSFSFGVPRDDQLEFFGNPDTPQLFRAAVQRLRLLGGQPVTIDFAPFLETACLLYEGPWVAERYAAIRQFIETKPDALFPVTRQIIGGATRFSAADTYAALYRLKALQRQSEAIWDDIEVLLTPTAGTIYTVAEVEAEPVRCNNSLGYYTNFMNLLDLSAIAVPAGFQSDRLPFGVTLCAPAFSDAMLLNLGARMQRNLES